MSDSRWHAGPEASFRWREWDGELVVHDASTGATHLLAPFSGTIFALLVQSPSPLNGAEIADAIGAGAAEGDISNMAADVADVLAELERIGLARRVTT